MYMTFHNSVKAMILLSYNKFMCFNCGRSELLLLCVYIYISFRSDLYWKDLLYFEFLTHCFTTTVYCI